MLKPPGKLVLNISRRIRTGSSYDLGVDCSKSPYN
jgi:hypothetical protein